eukprot:scaffold765_cov160-Amphora_coffeaeformis.AAC.14
MDPHSLALLFVLRHFLSYSLPRVRAHFPVMMILRLAEPVGYLLPRDHGAHFRAMLILRLVERVGCDSAGCQPPRLAKNFARQSCIRKWV